LAVKVAVSVMGRFHAFDLAGQLERRGYLHQLVTSYPKFFAARFGIPRARVSSVLSNELLRRGFERIPQRLRGSFDAESAFHDHYARRAAGRLRPGGDLLVAWSGSALPALRRARELGMTTVVERGSTHIAWQTDLLHAEYARFGLRPRAAPPRLVARELAEYAEADAIAVPSGFARQTFAERGVPPERLLCLPYGVSLATFAPPEGPEEPVFRVIHCGRVDLRKGCHYLIEAFHGLRLPRAELWLVGPVAPEMEVFRRRYASPAIVFQGPRPQAELARFYGRCAVFCLASLEEGMAMVIPQAMACGLPVIATPNSGAEEIVREGVEGHLVPVRDVEALRRSIVGLYEDPERRRAMGRAALARVRAGFTWDDYGDRVVAAYRALIARRGAPAAALAAGAPPAATP
jgi:glycosyltransferase involved in cell wall biosynthesis